MHRLHVAAETMLRWTDIVVDFGDTHKLAPRDK